MRLQNVGLVLFGAVICLLPLLDSWNVGVGYVFTVLWLGLVVDLSRKYSVHLLLSVLIFVLMMQAQWGLLQFIGQDDLGLYAIGETRLDKEAAGIAKFTLGEDKVIRAYGPYPHPNSMAGGLTVGFLSVGLWWLTKNRKHWLHSVVTNLVVLFLALGIIVSFSRNAYISVCFTLVIFLWGGKKLLCWRRVLLLFLVAGLFLTFFAARVADPEDMGVSERVAGIEWAGRLVDWNGLGEGGYKRALTEYLHSGEFNYEPWQVDYVHSVPILVAVEVGWVIALVLAGILGLVIKMNYADRWWWLMPLAPLIVFDHYMLTQPAAYALALVYLVLLYRVPARVVH